MHLLCIGLGLWMLGCPKVAGWFLIGWGAFRTLALLGGAEPRSR